LSLLWTLVIESLSWIELARINEDRAIRKSVRQLKIRNKDIVNEASNLVYETVRRQNALDYIIEEALRPNSLNDLTVGSRSFLRLYTYLVQYSNSSLIKAYELVDHAKKILGKNAFKQIKNIPEIISSLEIPYNTFSNAQRLAYLHFHPTWYVRYLLNQFGEHFTEQLILHVDYPNYLRLNRIKGTDISIKNLYEKGFQLVTEPSLSDTFVLLDDDDLTETEEYLNGHFIIQDKASILVGEIANPKPGDVVLDVCAAPGIKTSHIAQLMNNTGKIVSIDYNKKRLEEYVNLMKKLGVKNTKSIQADATNLCKMPEIDADIVLVDPPCTSTGVFHKNPSNKWRLNLRSIETMSTLQKKILWNSSRRLSMGGTLVYSTCSITIEENENVVQSLLDRDPEFKLVDSKPFIGEQGLMGLNKAQRFYPHKHKCNGFFIAKLKRIK
jgi:16S rRNA (cytosine967-C5)-methyltransferase